MMAFFLMEGSLLPYQLQVAAMVLSAFSLGLVVREVIKRGAQR